MITIAKVECYPVYVIIPKGEFDNYRKVKTTNEKKLLLEYQKTMEDFEKIQGKLEKLFKDNS